ncbi:MAG: acetyl-CoA synthetase, partial [Deltaproteobacteria bacterium]|nr:acetyl-CoA synthetase [Deltaproteobacteria bacterium]
MLDRYISRTQFDSYEDFVDNFSISVPDSFNFAYDVADEMACREPDRVALIWCDDKGNEAVFTFGQLK